MSPLRRLSIVAFWAAVTIAYVEAVLPAKEAMHLTWWDKLDHITAFFTITFLARAAYPRISMVRTFAALAIFGGLIELSQAVPWIHRDAEWDDLFADMAAIVVGLIVSWPIARVAGRRIVPASAE